MFNAFDPPEEPLICTVCHQPLTGDPEDQPDWPGGPFDGECYRACEFDQMVVESQIADEAEDLDW